MELITPKLEMPSHEYNRSFEDDVVAIHTELLVGASSHLITIHDSKASIIVPHADGNTTLKTEATDPQISDSPSGLSYVLQPRSHISFGVRDMTFTIERHRLGNPQIVNDPFFSLILSYFTSHLEQTRQNATSTNSPLDKKLAILKH